jgi:hypothetical protein
MCCVLYFAVTVIRYKTLESLPQPLPLRISVSLNQLKWLKVMQHMCAVL